MRAVAIVFVAAIGAIALWFLIDIESFVPSPGEEVYYRQPAFFPIVALSAVALAGFSLTLKYAGGGALSEDDELAGSTPHLPVLLPLIVAFAGYTLLIAAIGYLPATVVFGFVGLWLGRHLTWASSISLMSLAAVLDLVFVRYLDVWFPAPFVIEVIGG